MVMIIVFIIMIIIVIKPTFLNSNSIWIAWMFTTGASGLGDRTPTPHILKLK